MLDQMGFKGKRPIRSFVKRAGRMTKAQQDAWDRLWSEYGCEGPIMEVAHPFLQDQPWVLEIGFGMGASFLEMAMMYPHENYIGIEVHPPGVGAVLQGIEKHDLQNIRLYREDATMVCREWIPDGSLSRIQIYFSDPWPKKRHHKRRLIQNDFIALLARKLKPGGFLHLVTDIDHYADHMQTVLASFSSFHRLEVVPYLRPMTKYERFALEKGHVVTDLLYRLDSSLLT